MKFLVFSDSHGETKLMQETIEATRGRSLDGIIFLGDYIRDAEKIKKLFPDLTLYAVPGNCDFLSTAPQELLLEINNAKIFMAHGHRYGVKSGYERITAAAVSGGANAAFFGHSHIPICIEKNGITLLNPGSITEPRGGYKRKSYAIIEIIGGKIISQIIEV